MNVNAIKLPNQQEIEQAKESSRLLARYTAGERLHLKVRAENSDKFDDMILPASALDILLRVLTETSKGNAVHVLPVHAELTTQEAADFLNVSRPYLVGLLEKGELAFRKVGSHRRILAKDVIEYKQQQDALRMQALDELTALSQEMGYE